MLKRHQHLHVLFHSVIDIFVNPFMIREGLGEEKKGNIVNFSICPDVLLSVGYKCIYAWNVLCVFGSFFTNSTLKKNKIKWAKKEKALIWPMSLVLTIERN